MKLAKAPQEEIDRLMSWLQAREKATDAPPPFMRVVFGYETLVQNCCDPEKDYLDFKPGYSPAEVDALQSLVKQMLSALKTCRVYQGEGYDSRGMRCNTYSFNSNLVKSAIAKAEGQP